MGFATVREAYLGSKGKTALHLETEVAQADFEKLIRPLLEETLEAIDRALADANVEPKEIDRIILVGGSTRIPLVQKMIEEHLGQAPTDGIQPDLCVALGAALQAGVLVGESVDAILVDVIPHSLGVAAAVDTPMGFMPGYFSVIIPRNSVVPVSRSHVYSTLVDKQEVVEIEVFQGENVVAEENVPLGSFKVENLPPKPAGDIKIEVHFDFDLNGILTVTTTEKGKGQQGTLVVNNAGIQKLSSHELTKARADLEALFEFESDETIKISAETIDDAVEITPELSALLDGAQKLLETIDEEQAEELQDLLDQIEDAITNNSTELPELQEELEDFLYYANNDEEE
jgi:molecular chaperone DnaK